MRHDAHGSSVRNYRVFVHDLLAFFARTVSNTTVLKRYWILLSRAQGLRARCLLSVTTSKRSLLHDLSAAIGKFTVLERLAINNDERVPNGHSAEQYLSMAVLYSVVELYSCIQ